MHLSPLRRADQGAVIGGVCAGLARRWQVDPTVLRIAAILLALLGGVGIACYVGALLLVPKYGATEFPLYRVAPFTRSWSPAAAIGAVVCLGGLIVLLGGSLLPFALAPVVGLGFLWYFGFHRQRRTVAPDQSALGQPALGNLSATDESEPPMTVHTAAAPPSLDPQLGVPQSDFERAAAAWRQRIAEERLGSIAEPTSPERWLNPSSEPSPYSALDPDRPTPLPAVRDWTPPSRRPALNRPKWVWPLVLCLLGAGLATLGVLTVFGLGVPLLAYPATALGALGLGLLASAFARRPRGLLPLTVIAGLVTLALVLPFPRQGSVGDHTFSYSTMAQLPRGEVSHGAGEVTVDLHGLTITESRGFRYSHGVGEVRLQLPPTGNVVVEWSLGAGEYSGPDGAHDGVDLTGTYRRIFDPAGPVLTVQLQTGAGEVTVTQ